MKLEWKTCFKVGVSIFLLYLCFFYWKAVANLFGVVIAAASPLIVGAVIAYLVNILMSFYEKYYFPNTKNVIIQKSKSIVCMLAAFVTLIGIVVFVICLIMPELTSCVTILMLEVPRAIDKLVDGVVNSGILAEIVPADIIKELNAINWQDSVSKIWDFVVSALNGMGGAVSSVVTSVISVFSGMVSALISIIFSIYILLGKDRLKFQFHLLIKNYLPSKCINRVEYVISVINECFHKYIVGQCVEAVIIGALCAIGMTIFRFPYAIMIGALVSVTALIPVAGAYIGAGVGAFMIMTVSPVKAILFLIFIVVLQQLEGNLIYPRVVGSSLGLPGLWVLAAVIIGGSVNGVVGMLIGVPITAVAYRLIREDVEMRENKEKERLLLAKKAEQNKEQNNSNGKE